MCTPSIKLISTFAAILILSSTFNISHTQARLLPMENPDLVNIPEDLHRKTVETVAVAPLKSGPLAFDHDTSFATIDVEVLGGDFRPTTPGHSPGAGHSVAPTSHMDSKIH
ncbi:hypothetical protein E5676_scaffold134G003590 [Cucumis melo var. makuwa]|uniref:Uncharacterized protein n=1 Tax=Cucumis melo var. makuwa TaxID=1194695 RepID=A0A5D3D9H8_CUCMM|nr:hypothetical protein E5676_scaffold134G003590 [Cucumis melo var. makuwa]